MEIGPRNEDRHGNWSQNVIMGTLGNTQPSGEIPTNRLGNSWGHPVAESCLFFLLCKAVSYSSTMQDVILRVICRVLREINLNMGLPLDIRWKAV